MSTLDEVRLLSMLLATSTADAAEHRAQTVAPREHALLEEVTSHGTLQRSDNDFRIAEKRLGLPPA